MRTCLILSALTILLEGPASKASAAPRDSSVVDDAAAMLDELADLPAVKRIPPALLREADAVVIAPGVLKAGVLVGGRHGCGVLVVRGNDGTWGNPVFVTVTGGSFGLQVGVEATDLVLVIRSRRSLDRILHGSGKLTLARTPRWRRGLWGDRCRPAPMPGCEQKSSPTHAAGGSSPGRR
jgi:lipid-binding SYLF domain-containing protein